MTGSRMFSFITESWNPFTGACGFECSYCWARGLINRYGYAKYLSAAPGVDERQINRRFKAGEFVFVQDMSDVAFMPYEAVTRVLDRVRENPETRFLFLTKDPRCYLRWLDEGLTLPLNAVYGATVETNRATSQWSKAPPPYARLKALLEVQAKGLETFISVEPVMEFDRDVFLPQLAYLRPSLGVAVGLDNYHNGLPEPSPEKAEELARALEARGVKVYRKNMRAAG